MSYQPKVEHAKSREESAESIQKFFLSLNAVAFGLWIVWAARVTKAGYDGWVVAAAIILTTCTHFTVSQLVKWTRKLGYRRGVRKSWETKENERVIKEYTTNI